MLLESFTRLAGEEYRCGYDHLMGAIGLWLSGKRNDRIDFPEGWTAIRVDDGLLLRRTPSYESPPVLDSGDMPIVREGECKLPEVFSVVGKVVARDKIVDLKHPPRNTVYLNEGFAGRLKIDYNRVAGREIKPLGMGGHTHKVSDLVSRAGVARHRREWMPLLLDADDLMEVIAIPHLGLISERGRVGERDGQVFVVKIEPGLGDGVR
jgi:hypothetical protein